MPSEQRCPTCGTSIDDMTAPPCPPVGTRAKDRSGDVWTRGKSGRWFLPGCFETGLWEAMWFAIGPMEVVE